MSGAARGFELRDGLYFAAEITIGIVAVLSNSLVVIVITQTPALRTVTNLLICNLAAADICVGLFVMPSAVMSFYGFPANYYGCVFINCILLIFTNVSVMQLFIIALDRFFAIKYPFKYHTVMNKERVCYINITVWVLGINTGLIPLYGWRHPYKETNFCRFTEVITFEHMVYLQFFGIILFSEICMFIIYIYIFFVVRKQARIINEMNLRFASEADIKAARKIYKYELKAAKLIFLAIALFVCRTPINIFNCITLFCKTCKYPYILLLCSIVLSHTNSCWNPWLYAVSNSTIKLVLKRFLRAYFVHHASDINSWNVVSLQSLERSTERVRSNRDFEQQSDYGTINTASKSDVY